ncbi:MAG TPA: hypothetical protein VGR97_13965 [Candidatus Acidoferrales bacterium]|nr:hypothetical protein [Candidatus Acidoferrales bacterium]
MTVLGAAASMEARQLRPDSAPLATSLKLILEPGASFADVKQAAESLAADELARMNEFTMQLTKEDFYRSWEDRLRCECCA